MNTNEIIAVVNDLPVEERAKIADSIRQSLNPIEPEIEEAWIKEAERRIKQVESGEVEMISAGQFEKHVREMQKEYASE